MTVPAMAHLVLLMAEALLVPMPQAVVLSGAIVVVAVVVALVVVVVVVVSALMYVETDAAFAVAAPAFAMSGAMAVPRCWLVVWVACQGMVLLLPSPPLLTLPAHACTTKSPIPFDNSQESPLHFSFVDAVRRVGKPQQGLHVGFAPTQREHGTQPTARQCPHRKAFRPQQAGHSIGAFAPQHAVQRRPPATVAEPSGVIASRFSRNKPVPRHCRQGGTISMPSHASHTVAPRPLQLWHRCLPAPSQKPQTSAYGCTPVSDGSRVIVSWTSGGKQDPGGQNSRARRTSPIGRFTSASSGSCGLNSWYML